MARNRFYGFLMVAGAGAVIACAAVAGLQVRSDFGPSVAQHVPGQFDESLSPGKWAVYQLTGQASGAAGGGISASLSRDQAPTLTSSMIDVVAPGRRELPVAAWPGNNVETLRKGSSLYTAVASFDAPASGRYALRVTGRGAVLVARPLLSLLRVVLPWLLGIAAGVICFAGAGIVLIWKHRPAAADAARKRVLAAGS